MKDNEQVTVRIVWNANRKAWTVLGDARLAGNTHRHMQIETTATQPVDDLVFRKLLKGVQWDLEALLPWDQDRPTP